MTKVIYLTRFDHTSPNRDCLGASTPMPWATLDDAVAVLGEGYTRRGPRSVIYPGVMVSDFPCCSGPTKLSAIDARNSSGQNAATPTTEP